MRVVVRRPARGRIQVQMPYLPGGGNYAILRDICGERTRPVWNRADRCFEVARGHLVPLLDGLTERFGEVTYDSAYYASENCAAACWEADLASWVECTCGCLSEMHGMGRPEVGADGVRKVVDRGYAVGEVAVRGSWSVVSEGFVMADEWKMTASGLVKVRRRVSRATATGV